MNRSQFINGLQNSTLKPALISSLLCWLAFPPVGWSVLVWVAPMGWLSLVSRDHLAGQRPYRALWLAGAFFWLLTVHWIRLPHPLNYLLLVTLASYLGSYLPAFVALSRVGVHRLRLPLWLVAPVVWTGLDWVRAHLMTGFGMGSLAHTQVESPVVIQIANLAGEYGVTFLIVLVAACVTQTIQKFQWRYYLSSLRYLSLAMIAVVGTLIYGGITYNSLFGDSAVQGGPRIALIQGNSLADWKGDPDKQFRIMEQHYELSFEAIKQSRERDGRDVDLIIWPETMFRYPLAFAAENYQPPKEEFHESNFTVARAEFAEFAKRTNAAFLTGIDRTFVFPDQQGEFDLQGFNSSVLVDKQGQVVGTYDKMHLVVIGEYMPFSKWIPFLKRLTPMTGLATPGQRPQALEADGVIYCPNICYETAVPHLIRRHVTELAEAGKSPHVLVNLTNDAWYWGSSELDMHLACGVFRAVENHIPLLIAANGGLSAHVGPSGTIHQVSKRQQTETLLVDLRQPTRRGLTLYAKWGDWFAGVCVLCCVVLAVVGWRSRDTAIRSSRSDDAK